MHAELLLLLMRAAGGARHRGFLQARAPVASATVGVHELERLDRDRVERRDKDANINMAENSKFETD